MEGRREGQTKRRRRGRIRRVAERRKGREVEMRVKRWSPAARAGAAGQECDLAAAAAAAAAVSVASIRIVLFTCRAWPLSPLVRTGQPSLLLLLAPDPLLLYLVFTPSLTL